MIEVVNPDLKTWGYIADFFLLILLFILCVVSPGLCLIVVKYVRTVKMISFVFLKSKLLLQVNVLRMVEVRVSLLWTCVWVLCLLTARTGICCPRQLFITSRNASAPSSNSSNTDRSVLLSISCARHSTCCSCFQAAYLVISQPSGWKSRSVGAVLRSFPQGGLWFRCFSADSGGGEKTKKPPQTKHQKTPQNKTTNSYFWDAPLLACFNQVGVWGKNYWERIAW